MSIFPEYKIKLKDCPKCNSRKVYLKEAVIDRLLGIHKASAFVYCEQCGLKGKEGVTNTVAVSNWNKITDE